MTGPSAPAAPVRLPLTYLLTTMFLFAIGMSLVFPVLPFIIMRYVPEVSHQAAAIGWVTATFSLLAFFSAPVMGALCDAYGRKPVLLITLLGTALGHLLFGIGGSLAMLFLGRAVDGLTAGGMSSIFGYVADTTSREERGKVFGQLGATIGAGVIVGPAIGGLLSHVSLSAPMFAAAAVCVVNAVWGQLMLRESLPPERRTRNFDATRLNPLLQLRNVVSAPVLRRLVTVSVLFFLPYTLMSVVYGPLSRDHLRWGPAQLSTLFILAGAVGIVMQLLLLPRILKAIGEAGAARVGLGFGILGLLCVALVAPLASAALLYAGVFLFAAGEGLFNASFGTLLSLNAPPDMQGRVQGGAQAFNSLAQVAGPLTGGLLYSHAGPAFTLGLGAALVVVSLTVLLGLRGGGPQVTEAAAD